MSGGGTPVITWDDAAEVEPIEPKLVAAYLRESHLSGFFETSSPSAGAGFDRSK
jgi:hypothetical protein